MRTMEHYSTRKENEILSYAGKWMKQEDIMLSRQPRPRKTNATCSLLFTDPSSKSSDVSLQPGVTRTHETFTWQERKGTTPREGNSGAQVL